MAFLSSFFLPISWVEPIVGQLSRTPQSASIIHLLPLPPQKLHPKKREKDDSFHIQCHTWRLRFSPLLGTCSSSVVVVSRREINDSHYKLSDHDWMGWRARWDGLCCCSYCTHTLATQKPMLPRPINNNGQLCKLLPLGEASCWANTQTNANLALKN